MGWGTCHTGPGCPLSLHCAMVRCLHHSLEVSQEYQNYPFLPVPQDICSCLPQDGRAPMLRKHSAKSLYLGRVCQWCVCGVGEPERGWRGVVIFLYHCLALLSAADRFNYEQSHEWLSSSGLRVTWAHYMFSAPGTLPVITLHPMGHYSTFQVGRTSFVELIVL